MTRSCIPLVLASVFSAASAEAQAPAAPAGTGANGCSFRVADGVGKVDVAETARLVARLVDPPRTRVTLSIDDLSGNHTEIVWDPAVDDGLQHSTLLQGGNRVWTFSPSIEDERIQSGQIVLVIGTSFSAKPRKIVNNNDALTIEGTRMALLATAQMSSLQNPTQAPGKPRIELTCEAGQVEMSALRLDSRRVAAAATARGFLDQTVPAPVKEALSLLAEIAITRAKAGAMELVKKKFVQPMCTELTMSKLGLSGSGLAFPATCALLEQLRLTDVLSSGRALVDAAKDDIRSNLAPALLDVAITSDETRELARLALDFGNRMIDGEWDTVVAIDLLVSLLDHLEWSSGFEQSEAVVLAWLDSLKLSDDAQQEIVAEVLDATVPVDLDDIERKWGALNECANAESRVTATLAGLAVGQLTLERAYDQLRGKCLSAIAKSTTIKTALSQKLFKLTDLFVVLKKRAGVKFSEYLHKTRASELRALRDHLDGPARNILANTCAVRAVVGVAKWCSGRESCSAGDIADVLDNPQRFFKQATELPESLCWRDDGSYIMPDTPQRYIDLGVRLVSFLRPPAKGEERVRAQAMVRWLFAVLRTVNPDSGFVVRIQDIVSHLIEGEQLRALTETFRLTQQVACDRKPARLCKPEPAVAKTLQLLGAVASYMRTVDETKSLDPDEARAARRRALESLIDSATERAGRNGSVVYSIGAPVGFAFGGRVSPGTATSYSSVVAAYDPHLNVQLRVPLAIARQALPSDDSIVGTHLGLWIADLGQLARANDDLKWNDFVGVGLQAGLLLGTADHAAVLALEASWSPGLYAREVTIKDDHGVHMRDVSGAFSFGLTIAYYVPFFDLN